MTAATNTKALIISLLSALFNIRPSMNDYMPLFGHLGDKSTTALTFNERHLTTSTMPQVCIRIKKFDYKL